MKKILFHFILFSLAMSSFAQVPVFQWAKQMGGSGFDIGRAITVDALGNVYTLGDFTDTVDFDPGPGIYNLVSSGENDVFISKLDNSGNLAWVKQFEGVLNGYGFSIAIDEFGNIYTSGTFNGSVDFDPGAGTATLTSGGLVDLFISKLDASGNFIWAKQMQGSLYYCQASSIRVGKAGDLYYTGAFQYTVDFDPGPGVFNLNSYAGGNDIVVSKLDSSGNFLWAKQLGGTATETGNSIVLDSLDNVYTSGYFEGTADFDPGVGVVNLTSAGNTDIFISKLDSLGNFVWVKKIGGVLADVGKSIAIDTLGNIYTTGTYSGTVDFDPGSSVYNLTSIGNTDIYISKLDSSGNFVWTKNMGSNSYICGGYSITLDNDDDIYISGFYEGTVDFDPGAGTFNLTFVYGAGGPGFTIYPDMFILKLDPFGNFAWATGIGGNGVDYASSLVIDEMKNVYTTGTFGNTVDFDPGSGTQNLTSLGGQDVFVHKINQTPVGIQEYSSRNSFILLYPNPTTNNLTIETIKPTTISIINVVGQELFNSKVESSETINVSFLSNGIYFVKDVNNGGTVKFIKQ